MRHAAMRTMPRISVVIPTYNRIELLPRAIESAQSAGTEVEVVVVDDASTDGTEEYCRSLEHIKYVRLNKNHRTAGARNAGIEASTAPFIAFLDDDDIRLEGSLDKQICLFESDPNCGLVYGQFLPADQEGNPMQTPPQPEVCIEGDIFWDLLESNRFGCLTVVVKRETLDQVGHFDTGAEFTGIEDYDLWIRIAERFTIRSLCEPVGIYRVPTSSSGQWSSNETRQYLSIAHGFISKWMRLGRFKERYGDDIDLERKRYLRNVSERIIHDMAYRTPERRRRLGKLFSAVKVSPSRLLEPAFYKTIAMTLIRRTRV